MKKLIPVLALAILFAAFGTPAARACSMDCGYGTHPWGTPFAVCLSYPTDDGYAICIEINTKEREYCECAVHECALFLPCRGGYPIA